MTTKFKTRLAPWVIQKILASVSLKSALMDLNERSERTIMLWCKTNNPMLRTNDSLSVIAAYLRIEPERLIEPQEDPDSQSAREDAEFHHHTVSTP